MTMDKTRGVDWHLNFQDEDYLRLSVQRLQDEAPPLDWCAQFAELINRQLGVSVPQALVVHDIGCNVGHFCRVLDLLPASMRYRGYDISQTYLTVARTKYPLREFCFLDIEKEMPSEPADMSVISATLEHIQDWEAALGHILSSTTRHVFLRSFFGASPASDLYKKATASQPYLIRQFTFEQMAEAAKLQGFSTRFIRDLATDSVPQYLGCGVTRTQYIAVLSRHQG